MQDDRFLRRGQELFDVMSGELTYLHDLPPLVWERTSVLISEEQSPHDLRDMCLLAAHIGAAYLWDDSFEQLSRSPLNITQGNVSQNIADIASGTWQAGGNDSHAAQVRACLDTGTSAAELVRFFETVRDSAASINLVEQGHASHAVVLKQHEQVEERLLRARSTIHQCRAMLRPAAHSRVQSLQAAIAKLDRSQLHRCSFRAFSSLLPDAEVAEALGEQLPRPSSPGERLSARHRLFARLPRPLLAEVEMFTEAHARERARRLQLERNHLQEELQLVVQAAQADRDDRGLCNTVADCKLSDDDLLGLLQVCNAFGPADKHRVEHEVFQPVDVPPESVRQAMLDHELVPLNVDMPWWARHVSAYREYFRGAVISSDEGFGTAWLILVAKQGQVKVVTLEARRRPCVLDMGLGAASFCDLNKFVFEIFPLVHRNAIDLPLEPDRELLVLPHTFFEGQLLCALCSPVPFEQFTGGLPPKPFPDAKRARRDAGERVPRATPEFRTEFLRANPWLSEKDIDEALGKKRLGGGGPCSGDGRSRRSRSPSSESASEASLPEEPTEAGGPAVDAELAPFEASDLAAIREAEHVAEHRHMDFYVRVLGGAWTLAHTGEVADGCSYFSRGGNPQAWCRRFSFPRQKGYHYRRYGGREGPHVMCNEIVRRAQYFYDLWLCSPDSAFKYSEAHLAAYGEGGEFREWCTGLEPGSLLSRQAAAIRDLIPRNPL